MPAQDLPPSTLHMLERNIGKKIRVITTADTTYGYEGTLGAVTQEPATIYITEVDIIVLRSTIAQPIPQITNREEAGDMYLDLKSIQRIEVLHQTQNRHK